MYLQNKYTKWYYNIIQDAHSRTLPLDVYVEKHHVIPRSLGGDNKKTNIAKLTPKEHFVCHLLLTKMTTGNSRYKMLHALTMLTNVKNIGKGRYTPTGKIYEYVRKCHNEGIKLIWTHEKRKQQSSKLKNFYATIDKTSEQYKNKISKISEFQKTKIWSEKAIQVRLDNCLKSASARKGKPWSEEKRKSNVDTYLRKNLDIALQIFKLYDAGMNRLRIANELNITWDKVNYSLLYREKFELYHQSNL